MIDRDQWLRDRLTGVGGSDAAAVLGLSKWKTPLQLYLEKRGEVAPTEDNEPMRWGRLLEPVVRQEYAERSGQTVRLPEGLLRHPLHPWMLATIDGVTDSGRLVELKTARSAEGWGEPGSDEIPQAYLIQVQHYLTVTQLSVADVAVLIGGQDFRQYEVAADAELQQMIVEAESQFWSRVQRADPPDPSSLSDLLRKYGRASRAGVVIASEEIIEWLAELRRLKTERVEMEAAEEEAKAVVLACLGECDTLASPSGEVLATWKASKAPLRFDTKAFEAAHPDLHSQFLKAGEPSRRFLLKG
jgi:putative phage-type endonuclease